MRNAYALLGICFIIVFGGAYVLFHQAAEAPTTDALPTANQETEEQTMLTLTSSAFSHNDLIPSQYTCDGENMNPPLSISGVPEGTESLVLVMDDPDIPEEIKAARGIEKFNHWAVYNLPIDTKEIPSSAIVGAAGMNSRGESTYTGPCPPTEYEPTEHRYVFRLYALSGTLNFIKTPTLDEIEAAAEGMMLEKAELIGRYSRVQE
jgi:Raf kinase inhibitor-like YbhB/YbcL family protein